MILYDQSTSAGPSETETINLRHTDFGCLCVNGVGEVGGVTAPLFFCKLEEAARCNF